MSSGIWKTFLRKSVSNIDTEDDVENAEDSVEAKEKKLDEKRYINLPDELRESHEKVLNRIIELDSEPVDEWKLVEDSNGLKGWKKEGTSEDEQPIIKSEYFLPFHYSQVLSFIWDLKNQYIIYPGVERMHFPVSYNDRTNIGYRVTKAKWPFNARQICTSGGFRVYKGQKMIFYQFSHDFVKKIYSKFIVEDLPFPKFDFSSIIFEPMEGDRTKVVRLVQSELVGFVPKVIAERMWKKSLQSIVQLAEAMQKYSADVPVNHTSEGRNDNFYLDEDSILKEFSSWRVSENPLRDANLGILVENAAAYFSLENSSDGKVIEEVKSSEEDEEDCYEERSVLGAGLADKTTGTVIESDWDEISHGSIEVKRSFGGICTAAFCVGLFSKQK